MKLIVLFAAIVLLSVHANGAVLQPAVGTRSNLNAGWVSAGDRVLYRNYFYKAPMANAIQSQDIIYRGDRFTRITAVQVTEVGYTQFANVYILAGGIGANNTTIRLVSARGYGYYYLVDIWGH